MSTTNLEHYARKIANNINYDFSEFVGSGAYKETFRISNDTHQFALKVFDPNKFNFQRTEREINSIKKCNHKGICKTYDFGSFPIKDQKIYYCLEEFLDGGSLSAKLTSSKDSDHEVIQCLVDIIDALEHLKSLNLVHRDIKPENIMFRSRSNYPVLVDFGLVRDLGNVSLTPSWLNQGPGTPIYAAPEQLNNEKHLIDWRSDQFSVGIILGMHLTGLHPYQEKGGNLNQAIIRMGKCKKPTTYFISAALEMGYGDIQKMVQPWPIDRIQTIQDLKNTISNLN